MILQCLFLFLALLAQLVFSRSFMPIYAKKGLTRISCSTNSFTVNKGTKNILATTQAMVCVTPILISPFRTDGVTGRRDGGTEGRDGGTEGRRDGGTEGRRDGRTEGRRDGRTEGRRDGGTEGRTDERTDGRTDGRTDPLIEMRGSI